MRLDRARFAKEAAFLVGRQVRPRIRVGTARFWPWLRILLWAGAACGAFPVVADTWRRYGVEDGLADAIPVAVTVSPRGNVWVLHPGGRAVSWLDGFDVRTISPGPAGNYPVHESRSGQIWALQEDGVTEYRAEGWYPYMVPEVRAEREAHPLRMLRAMPLLPAERDRVLVLLPEQLVVYEAQRRRSQVLRRASDAGLGRFIDILQTREGDLWVAGARGLAKLTGPARRLTPETTWEVALLPDEFQLQLVGRIYEDEEGGLTGLAEASDEVRAVVYFDGLEWQVPIPAPPGTRGAWRGTGGTVWAHTRAALFARRGNDWETESVPELEGAQIYEVAPEWGDVFWLATSAGVLRHSPNLWRAVGEARESAEPVWSLLEAAESRMCCLEDGGLRVLENDAERYLPFPAAREPMRGSRPVWLGGAVWFVDTGGELQRCNVQTGECGAVAHPSEGRRIRRLLGILRDGRAAVQTVESGLEERMRVEAFDGDRFEDYGEVEGLRGGPELYFLVEGPAGERWVGGGNGLQVCEPRSQQYRRADGWPELPALCLYVENSERVWCGSDDGVHLREGRVWRWVRAGCGRVRQIVGATDGSVWFALGQRVSRYARGIWTDYGVEHGLPRAEVWDCRPDSRGEVWAATDLGVRRLSREVDVDPPRTQVVMLEGGVREVSVREHPLVTFSGRDKWDMTLPERLRFATRLDEGPWSLPQVATSVTVSTLTAGPHRFSVRAMDEAMNEELQPAVLEFTAYVPWFAEPRLVAVMAAALLLALGLAWLAVNSHFRLVRSYAEVERIVGERTRELERANQELLHSQKMRALGTLAAGIAHDFNSILSIIRGSAQIIEANLEDREKIRTRVNRIKTMVDQGSGIVRAILGLTLTGGQAAQSVDLVGFLQETVRLVGDQLPAGVHAEVEVHPETAPGACALRSDLLRQVLLNLLFNAADATSGPGRIRVLAERTRGLPSGLVLAPAAAAEYIAIRVIDSGHGITPEVLPRIFEPFFTTKALSTRKGTGLGLTMVYEIAKEGGFGLRVESVVREGTTFTVFVPLESSRVS